MLVEGIQAYLAADTGMQAVLGTTPPAVRSDKTNGLFPAIAMASADLSMPYVVYQQVSGENDVVSMQGTNRLQVARWRFSCYGGTYKQARQLGQALKYAMLQMDGPLPGTSTKADVHGSWCRLEADDIETIPHATIFAMHLDFELRWLDYGDIP